VRRQIPADERQKITQYLSGACRLVILTSPRQEFAPARACAVIFFLQFLFSQKEIGNKKTPFGRELFFIWPSCLF